MDGVTGGVYLKDLSVGGGIKSVSPTGNVFYRNGGLSSDGSKLVYTDADGTVTGVYVYDQKSGTSTLVSTSANGAQHANASSDHTSISGDGTLVAFYTDATNLVPNGTKGVYVKNLLDGTVSYVGPGSDAWISSNGRYVTFTSKANDLVPGDINNSYDVFVKDLSKGTITRASFDTDGQQFATDSFNPTIDANGDAVAFQNGHDVYVNYLASHTVLRLSQTGYGDPADGMSEFPVISDDGQQIAFASEASNIVHKIYPTHRDTLVATPNVTAPVIDSSGGGNTAAVTVPENTTFVTKVSATDPDPAAVISYSIAGGADQGKFGIDAETGILSFLSKPDFEHPSDYDHNNSYIVQVRASDGVHSDDQTLTVNIGDIRDEERVDGGAGHDTVTFNFKLIDATFKFAGNQVIVETANGGTILNSVEEFHFLDGTVNIDDGDPLDNDLFYYSQYHDVWNAHVDADAHYRSAGVNRAEAPMRPSRPPSISRRTLT